MNRQFFFGHAGRLFASASALCLVGGLAHGAALEQAVPSTLRLLYEEGTYAEFGITYTDPDQSGEDATIPAGVVGPVPFTLPGNTGDVFEDRWNFSGAWKNDINDRWSYVIGFDQPFIADTSYGRGSFLPNPINFTYDGSSANLTTYQITGVLAYDVNQDVKVFGGLRAQWLNADAALPFIAGYSVDADPGWGFGWLVGAAYARPEIGLRIGLTYFSEIKHDLDTAEYSDFFGAADTSTDINTPQSVTLDAQTGVAEGTLVFGSIRWVDWSEFTIAPPLYSDTTAGVPGLRATAGRLRRRLVDLQRRRRPAVDREPRGIAFGDLRARRRRRDDEPRTLRRPHHRHRGAELRLRPDQRHRRADLRGARRHRSTCSTPTTTTVRSGARG